MSDKPISKGDLVMMVRGHQCCLERYLGIPFVVTGFVQPIGGGWKCRYCGLPNSGPNEIGATGLGNGPAPISWLIRLDPPAIQEDIPAKEEIHA